MQAGVAAVAAAIGSDAHRLAATGGEDFELLFTVDEPDVAAVAAAIGRRHAGSGASSRPGSGGPGLRLRRGADVVVWDGFEHLR